MLISFPRHLKLKVNLKMICTEVLVRKLSYFKAIGQLEMFSAGCCIHYCFAFVIYIIVFRVNSISSVPKVNSTFS